ncbi:MAG TPA: hypothetical protein VNZ86_12485, partial [Bacteroidia bacterium]|nr:hypothetical protein [Bacteroidia bacterium]
MADPTPNPRQPAADIALQAEGDDAFILGMDSYSSPYKLLAGEYQMAMNVVNRGGMVQTRPGSLSKFTLPSGQIQGCTLFAPSGQIPALVFAVSGKIYVSLDPFDSFTQLNGIQFNPYSKFISWASCIQSTDYDPSGNLITLSTPKNILMIQDGSTRAAYWDGTNASHLNPTPTPANPITASIV